MGTFGTVGPQSADPPFFSLIFPGKLCVLLLRYEDKVLQQSKLPDVVY